MSDIAERIKNGTINTLTEADGNLRLAFTPKGTEGELNPEETLVIPEAVLDNCFIE